MQGASEYQK
jgi:charged multivesicular body protein 5